MRFLPKRYPPEGDKRGVAPEGDKRGVAPVGDKRGVAPAGEGWVISERTVRIGAFAAIYLIWGSTYLGMRMLAETNLGLSLLGIRFMVAGLVLFLWARLRGAPWPEPRQWRAGILSGWLLLGGGGGGVMVALATLESGLVALLVGTVPLWIAVLLWLWPGRGARPSLKIFLALLIGFGGVAILAAPGDVLGGEPVHLPAVLVTVLACLSWAIGSLYSRTATLPSSPHVVSSVQMLAGGVLLTFWGLAAGDWQRFAPQAITLVSVLALLYLIVFGSLIAFSAYSWLIRTTEPTLVSTYAYVNPVVAVFLGWLIADESVDARILVAAGLIVGSVILVTTASTGGRKGARQPSQPEAAQPHSARHLRMPRKRSRPPVTQGG